MHNNKTLLDLSGYSFTGKSAVYDFITEYDGVKGQGREVEFDLFRSRGGILDLYNSISTDWGLVRSSVAIRDFKRMIYFLGGNRSIIHRLTRGGAGYCSHFDGFERISENYLKSLVDVEWKGYWPFYDYTENPIIIPIKKIYYKLFEDQRSIYLSRIEPDIFLSRTENYIAELLESSLSGNQGILAVNNSLDPANPMSFLKFYNSYKSIIVDRDPRDVYLSAMNHHNKEVASAVLGCDVYDFVRRFKMYRASGRTKIKEENILRVSFEDFVLNHALVKKEIEDFVGMDSLISQSKAKSNFDPLISSKNIGMWKNIDKENSSDIDIIESELKEYLVDF